MKVLLHFLLLWNFFFIADAVRLWYFYSQFRYVYRSKKDDLDLEEDQPSHLEEDFSLINLSMQKGFWASLSKWPTRPEKATKKRWPQRWPLNYIIITLHTLHNTQHYWQRILKTHICTRIVTKQWPHNSRLELTLEGYRHSTWVLPKLSSWIFKS